jgi:hypothetical protein
MHQDHRSALEVPANPALIRSPTLGFEPRTCCLRNGGPSCPAGNLTAVKSSVAGPTEEVHVPTPRRDLPGARQVPVARAAHLGDVNAF